MWVQSLGWDATQETWVPSLGQEGPLEEDIATQSSILAWRIPCTEESGRLWSIALQTARRDWSNLAHTHAVLRNYLHTVGTWWVCEWHQKNVGIQIIIGSWSKPGIFLVNCLIGDVKERTIICRVENEMMEWKRAEILKFKCGSKSCGASARIQVLGP